MTEVVQTLLPWKGAAGVAWLVLFLAAERLFPVAREPSPAAPGPAGRWHRLGRNLGLWLANVGLYPLIVLPVSVWATGYAIGVEGVPEQPFLRLFGRPFAARRRPPAALTSGGDSGA